MATFSKSKSFFKIRSISLPCRSHPSTSRIEVELNKIKSKEAPSTSFTQSSKHITNDISTLKELYKSTDDLLKMQTTKLVLSRCSRFVDDLQDTFVRLMDIIVTSIELVSQVKEHGRDTQSSLRRAKSSNTHIEIIVSKNTCFRKKSMKDAKILISKLKQMENKFGTLSFLEANHHVSSVIRSIREVVGVTIVFLNSIYLLLCAPISKPQTKWLTVSKLLQKGAAEACDNQIEDLNELQNLDIALAQLCKSDSSALGDYQKMKLAQDSLKSLEISVIKIEGGLECLFRGLIRSKTSLLNIVSSFV